MPKDKKAASDDLYKRLGVPKDADEGQIKKAYRMLALKHHPDKGGDAEAFKSYAEAYAVLSDAEKCGCRHNHLAPTSQRGTQHSSRSHDMIPTPTAGGACTTPPANSR